MPPTDKDFRRSLVREPVVIGTLVLSGVLLLPVVVYFVGKLVFGDYEGGGYGDFFSALIGRLQGGETSAWFLVLSPLLLVLLLRGLWWGWRASANVRPAPLRRENAEL